MTIKLLGQGFNPEMDDSVGHNLIRLLSREDFTSMTWFAAFASEPGIRGLSSYLEQAKGIFKKITIIVGVDQKGTSREALDAILDLGINAFVFYQPSNSIFHPKIYLFEGDAESVLIVGSSNLTVQGLFTNVETSLLITFDNQQANERETVTYLKNYFRGIFELNDPNLKPLSQSLIDQLVESLVVPNEQERHEIRDNIEKDEKIKAASLLQSLFPNRATPKIPLQFRIRKKSQNPTRKAPGEKMASIADEETVGLGQLVWRRRNLPASSVQVSTRRTNPTGGLRLVQDGFVVGGKIIDQTTYFRNTLFAGFEWKIIRQNPLVEMTVVNFHVFIHKKYIGRYALEIRHKPSGEAGQHNYTTSISWGDLGNIIREANLTGAQLDIYAPANQADTFTLMFTKSQENL